MSAIRRTGLATLAMAVAFAVPACTSDEAIPDPAEIETCDGLVDVGTELVRAYARLLEDVRIEDLAEGAEIPGLDDLEQVGDDLDASVARLGCDADDLNARIAAEVGDLETGSPAAAVLLEVVRSGVITPTPSTGAPPAPSTTNAG